MKYRKSMCLAPASLLAIVLLSGCGVNQLPDPMYTPTGVDLRLGMRELWSAQATWTQAYVADALAGMTDAADVASNRLMRNTDDIANRLKTYYGEDAGSRLAGLLRDRVSAMAGFVAAAPFRDSAQQTQALDQWNANTDSVAEFLAGLNPQLSRQTLADLLDEFVNLASDEVLARMDKKYETEVKDCDGMQLQASRIADDLTTGIIKQFPTNFQTVKPH
jgi:hypothetical protein